MNELKPVAIVYEDNSLVYSELVDRAVKPGTNLYAIPDTHRVVSVELLDWIADSCSGTDAETAIRAIINPDRSGG